MCTVTYVRTSNKVILTSNRDEQINRAAAEEPRSYTVNGRELTFPRDPQSGGTWFVMDTEANVAILLNGAAEKHQPRLHYRKSRGLILLDLMSHPSILTAWDSIDLDVIEPFTIITYWKTNLYQLRWDSTLKKRIKLDSNLSYIWSSATLYSTDIQALRKQWFNEFLSSQSCIDEKSIREFHLHTESSNTEYGLVINRNEQIKTRSLTQAVISTNETEIYHHNLQEIKTFDNSNVPV